MLLVLRSVVFTCLLPAVVVGWVPLRFFERHIVWSDGALHLHEIAALAIAALAGAGYLHCAWQFMRKGRGTVVPFDPPRKLVHRGLYRWVRNPMYLCLGAIVGAEAVFFESWHIAIYLVGLTCLAQLLVVLHEEPEMSFRFGAMYEDYKRAVPRWFPRAPKRHGYEFGSTSAER